MSAIMDRGNFGQIVHVQLTEAPPLVRSYLRASTMALEQLLRSQTIVS